MTADQMIAENAYTGTMMSIYLRNAGGSPAYQDRDEYLANAVGFASRAIPMVATRQMEAS
jgi:hypothetical protein